MEPNQKPRTNAKDFFLNVGSIVALYTLIFSLVSLLFTVIDKAFPPINNEYFYGSSASISWPVATLIIFFPIYILLMWLLGKDYQTDPEKQNSGIHKWLTYITLFFAGLTVAGDLITVLYYFIDGRNITSGFLLKVLVLLVVAASVFTYYLSDVRGKLTSRSRMFWRVFSGIVIIGSIVWGFMVLGSPRTQQLYKYDEQKVNDLMNINSYVTSYYQSHGGLPGSLNDLAGGNNYYSIPQDQQSGKPYEYVLVGQSAKAYQLCADFNKASTGSLDGNVSRPYPYGTTWNHPAGHYCFTQTIDLSMYPPGKLPM